MADDKKFRSSASSIVYSFWCNFKCITKTKPNGERLGFGLINWLCTDVYYSNLQRIHYL